MPRKPRYTAKWLLLILLFVLTLVGSIMQEQMAQTLIQNLKVH